MLRWSGAFLVFLMACTETKEDLNKRYVRQALSFDVIGEENQLEVGRENQGHHRRLRSKLSKSEEKIKAKLQKKYNEYEDCMKKYEKLKRKFYNNFVKVEVAMMGENIKLNSMICIRPDQDPESYNVRWLQQLASFEKPKQVIIEDEKLVLTNDKSLIIEDVNLDDGGEYTCYHGNMHTATYMVDVLSDEDYINVFKPPDKGLRPAGPIQLPEQNLKLLTEWSEWSKCSRCNKRGENRRVGTCMVQKLHGNKPTKPAIPWLDHLRQGLPCRSMRLPYEVQSLKEVSQRKSEILVAYCFEPCPTKPPVKVYTDASGKVVETVHTGEGFVSMKEGRPKLPKLVKRKIIFEKAGQKVKLKCPHVSIENVAIRWQNGSQTIDALLIRRYTAGRVTITATQALAIQHLHYSDTAAYSCWIGGQHIGTIKVRVIDEMSRDYKDYILMAGYAAVAFIFLSICYGVSSAQRKRSLR